MTGFFFDHWLIRFDHNLIHASNKRALQGLENRPVHGEVDLWPGLKQIITEFLPPRTKSKDQPLDTGVIARVKRK